MFETFERTIAGLGGMVTALRLLGDHDQGLQGEIEIAGDSGRQTLVWAHFGDVAALAWRLQAEVQIPAEVASAATTTCRAWWPVPACESQPAAPAGS
jgi:hypothetical protein